MSKRHRCRRFDRIGGDDGRRGGQQLLEAAPLRRLQTDHLLIVPANSLGPPLLVQFDFPSLADRACQANEKLLISRFSRDLGEHGLPFHRGTDRSDRLKGAASVATETQFQQLIIFLLPESSRKNTPPSPAATGESG